MIKRLRIRFTIICMTILIAVFATVIAITNYLNYKQVEVYADNILDILAVNGGNFGDSFKPSDNPDFRPDIGPETKYETRFFVVSFDSNDIVKMVDMQHIVSVTREEAVEMATIAIEKNIEKNKEKGYSDDFRYLIKRNPFETQVIFVDCSRQIGIARFFVNISVIVTLVALTGLAFLVWFLTEKTVRPIAESYEKQKKFITDAGHELRTPLTIISANAEIIEIESGENECVDVIKKQVKRMTDMTKNLVMLSKLEERYNKTEKNDINLSDVCIDVISNFNKYIERENKTLNADIKDDIIIYGNEALIRNLLNILLDNACKYSLSEINVTLSKYKNKIIFEIKNDSSELITDDINNVFNRFYRSAEVRGSNIEGSGIGLSIAKEIVEFHKGDIKAISECIESVNYFAIKIVF